MELRALVIIAAGLVSILWPRWLMNRAKARYDRRLAELRAGAEETYFEEQRSLLAYPPRVPWRWDRLYGGLLVLLGLADLYLF